MGIIWSEPILTAELLAVVCAPMAGNFASNRLKREMKEAVELSAAADASACAPMVAIAPSAKSPLAAFVAILPELIAPAIVARLPPSVAGEAGILLVFVTMVSKSVLDAAVLVSIVARCPPLSRASSDVLRLVPALAVTEPMLFVPGGRLLLTKPPSVAKLPTILTVTLSPPANGCARTLNAWKPAALP